MGSRPSRVSNKVGVIRISSVNKIVIMEDDYVATPHTKDKAKGFLEYTEEYYYEEEVEFPQISTDAKEERNFIYEDIEESWSADGVKQSKM